MGARVFLTLAALLPYWRLLTFSVIFVPDDHFTSDIFNGELPGRVLVGQLLRGGHLPLWTSQLCSGYPLAGAPSDPLGLLLFALLPPAAALDALLIVILLVAAHGTFSLARRCGADTAGAVLAGLAFAGSGYIACQLKHLSIMSTIVWLPVGLVLIDRVFTPGPARRSLLTATLGLLYANQVLAGFPQSAYICGLLYGAFAVFRALEHRGALGGGVVWLRHLAAIGVALVLGAAAGAVVLLPLAELTSISDRAGPLDYRWATYTSYWPRTFFSFFVPYINGDASNGTYTGPPPFWEFYGYVGAATAVLAIVGAIRERRKPVVAFIILMTIVAFALVLGRYTPVYYAAYELVPGMSAFRAPTRFLIVVELGVVLLGGIGLTRLRAALERRSAPGSRVPAAIAAAVCVVTALDLLYHQPRQNPMVSASEWLTPPRTVELIRADTSAPRVFTPHHRDIHRKVHEANRGWTDVEPYYKLRDLLEPNIGAYWQVPAADCYVGLAPRWYVAAWGYHYFDYAPVSEAAFQEFDRQILTINPGFTNLLRSFGVTHLLSPYPGQDPALTLIAHHADAYVYRVEGSARVRVVPAARRVASDELAAVRMRQGTFDPGREILLMDAPDSIHPNVEDPAGAQAEQSAAGSAVITREDSRELVIHAEAPADSFLLIADMFYPGWRAEVDGMTTPVYRADISVRGIALPRGQHTVRFAYDPAPFFQGLKVTLAALATLLVWLAAAGYRHA